MAKADSPMDPALYDVCWLERGVRQARAGEWFSLELEREQSDNI